MKFDRNREIKRRKKTNEEREKGRAFLYVYKRERKIVSVINPDR